MKKIFGALVLVGAGMAIEASTGLCGKVKTAVVNKYNEVKAKVEAEEQGDNAEQAAGE